MLSRDVKLTRDFDASESADERRAAVIEKKKRRPNSLKTKKWRASEEGGDSPMPACS
jgi:hypothetical protein